MDCDMVKAGEKRFALVRDADGLVVNTCVWDGVTPWNDLPLGISDIECPAYVDPGWRYVGGEWLPPEPPPEPPPE